LREAIISIGKDLKNVFISKNQARLLVKKLNLSKEVLETYIFQLDLKIYEQISKKVVDIINLYGSGNTTT
jgi:protein associated with RNAse G/E